MKFNEREIYIERTTNSIIFSCLGKAEDLADFQESCIKESKRLGFFVNYNKLAITKSLKTSGELDNLDLTMLVEIEGIL